MDKDKDGRVTDIEYYRYLLEMNKQRDLDQARSEIRLFAKGLESYKLKTGAFPKTLEALWIEPNDFSKEMVWRRAKKTGPISDLWGTPYQLSTDEKSFLIRSNGPDRIADTDDDLTSRETRLDNVPPIP